MLSIRELEVRYGQVLAVRGISLDVQEGQVVGLIGSNGAGKSTLLNAVSGLLPASSGTITFNGEATSHRAAHRIAAGGLVQVPEGRQIFAGITVRENLEVACPSRLNRRQRMVELDRAFTLFPVLAEKSAACGGELSGGQQQMLAIGRALMQKPRLLMLDEPSLGLAPVIVDQVFEALFALRTDGMTILMVEQNAVRTLEFVDHCYVMERGTIVRSGPSAELAADRGVIDHYLATPRNEHAEQEGPPSLVTNQEDR